MISRVRTCAGVRVEPQVTAVTRVAWWRRSSLVEWAVGSNQVLDHSVSAVLEEHNVVIRLDVVCHVFDIVREDVAGLDIRAFGEEARHVCEDPVTEVTHKVARDEDGDAHGRVGHDGARVVVVGHWLGRAHGKGGRPIGAMGAADEVQRVGRQGRGWGRWWAQAGRQLPRGGRLRPGGLCGGSPVRGEVPPWR